MPIRWCSFSKTSILVTNGNPFNWKKNGTESVLLISTIFILFTLLLSLSHLSINLLFNNFIKYLITNYACWKKIGTGIVLLISMIFILFTLLLSLSHISMNFLKVEFWNFFWQTEPTYEKRTNQIEKSIISVDNWFNQTFIIGFSKKSSFN